MLCRVCVLRGRAAPPQVALTALDFWQSHYVPGLHRASVQLQQRRAAQQHREQQAQRAQQDEAHGGGRCGPRSNHSSSNGCGTSSSSSCGMDVAGSEGHAGGSGSGAGGSGAGLLPPEHQALVEQLVMTLVLRTALLPEVAAVATADARDLPEEARMVRRLVPPGTRQKLLGCCLAHVLLSCLGLSGFGSGLRGRSPCVPHLPSPCATKPTCSPPAWSAPPMATPSCHRPTRLCAIPSNPKNPPL